MNDLHLYPLPEKVVRKSGVYTLPATEIFRVPASFTKRRCAFYKELYESFTLGLGKAEFVCDATLKNAMIAGRYAGEKNAGSYDYAVKIDQNGAYLGGQDEKGTARAFTAYLQLISCAGSLKATSVYAPACELYDKPKVAFRGVHFCMFPKVKKEFLRQFIRLAGMYRMSHFVLEFWGTYRFTCMEELGWKDASFTKEEISPVLEEAVWLGMEIVPFFNCLGHASQSRIASGDHVVLQQQPLYAPLFEPDGWTWRTDNPDALALLRKVRKELCDLSGEGGYFHIGCDEAFSFAASRGASSAEKGKLLAQYLNSIALEMCEQGRKIIVWGDQLLDAKKFPPPYCANQVPDADTAGALDLLSREIVIADWQYDVNEGEIETSKYFKERGFSVLGSPWHCSENIAAHINTAIKYGNGVLLTTWNITFPFIAQLLHAAEMMWQGKTLLSYPEWMSVSGNLLRKLLPHEKTFSKVWLGE